MEIFLSPKFKADKLSSGKIEDKIDVFEDQITGWLFKHANTLCSPHYKHHRIGGMAVLTLVSSYFEMIESYQTGKSSNRRSKKFFCNGFLKVFDDLPAMLKREGFTSPDLPMKIAEDIYRQVRCGLFHEAGITSRIILVFDKEYPLAFWLEKEDGWPGSIVIDPCLFFDMVQDHFEKFVQKLRDPAEKDLRKNFVKFFDYRISRPGPVSGPPPS